MTLNVTSMFSSLVSTQPGDKVVNYPVRPVDTTTDFEGTAPLQPTQPVWSSEILKVNLEVEAGSAHPIDG